MALELCAVAYACCAFLYLVSIGIAFWLLGDNLNAMEDPKTDYLRQITTDWTTTPFIDIEVIDGWDCGEGKTEVFTRPWYGISAACDCLNIRAYDYDSSSYYDWSRTMVTYDNCDYDMKHAGCKPVQSWPTIW